MSRSHLPLASLLFFLLLFTCTPLASVDPEPPAARPTASVLTVIFIADPALDTLTVDRIIRAPGALRNDYPRTVAEPPAGHLLFSFLDEDERVLRQTTQPYPGPNRYEVPSEEGTIETVTVPEAKRVVMLRTNYTPRLQTLRVSWSGESAKEKIQTVSLRGLR